MIIPFFHSFLILVFNVLHPKPSLRRILCVSALLLIIASVGEG